MHPNWGENFSELHSVKSEVSSIQCIATLVLKLPIAINVAPHILKFNFYTWNIIYTTHKKDTTTYKIKNNNEQLNSIINEQKAAINITPY